MKLDNSGKPVYRATRVSARALKVIAKIIEDWLEKEGCGNRRPEIHIRRYRDCGIKTIAELESLGLLPPATRRDEPFFHLSVRAQNVIWNFNITGDHFPTPDGIRNAILSHSDLFKRARNCGEKTREEICQWAGIITDPTRLPDPNVTPPRYPDLSDSR